MSKINKVKHTREALLALIGGATLLISGCTGSENEFNATQLATPNKIASESADNYDDNKYGLITAPTLKSWIDNWDANKPAGISGKLVILQAGSGPAGFEYIAPNGSSVFTYGVSNAEWIQTRDNGVVQTKSMVPDGYTMDAFLSKFNIDPLNDMIVCGMGTGGNSQAMRAGRCWYMFRYWGAAKENRAVLNGGNGWIGANTVLDGSYFAAAASTPTWAGRATVKDLPENNFALQATLEDMMAIVPATDSNILDDGVFIWDARTAGEYNPTSDGDFRGTSSVQGHPNGALLLPYGNLLDSTAGYTYKPKAAIASYMTGAVDAGSVGFMDSTVQAVGEGRAYQTGDVVYTYCETTFRAMITGFATTSILGLPTRFYDGAMTEWNSLSSVQADVEGPVVTWVESTTTPGLYEEVVTQVVIGSEALMPFNSPWRSDKASRSLFLEKTATVVKPQAGEAGYIADAFADSANKIIEEDKTYKGLISSTSSNTASSGGSSGGAALPGNPCG